MSRLQVEPDPASSNRKKNARTLDRFFFRVPNSNSKRPKPSSRHTMIADAKDKRNKAEEKRKEFERTKLMIANAKDKQNEVEEKRMEIDQTELNVNDMLQKAELDLFLTTMITNSFLTFTKEENKEMQSQAIVFELLHTEISTLLSGKMDKDTLDTLMTCLHEVIMRPDMKKHADEAVLACAELITELNYFDDKVDDALPGKTTSKSPAEETRIPAAGNTGTDNFHGMIDDTEFVVPSVKSDGLNSTSMTTGTIPIPSVSFAVDIAKFASKLVEVASRLPRPVQNLLVPFFNGLVHVYTEHQKKPEDQNYRKIEIWMPIVTGLACTALASWKIAGAEYAGPVGSAFKYMNILQSLFAEQRLPTVLPTATEILKFEHELRKGATAYISSRKIFNINSINSHVYRHFNQELRPTGNFEYVVNSFSEEFWKERAGDKAELYEWVTAVLKTPTEYRARLNSLRYLIYFLNFTTLVTSASFSIDLMSDLYYGVDIKKLDTVVTKLQQKIAVMPISSTDTYSQRENTILNRVRDLKDPMNQKLARIINMLQKGETQDIASSFEQREKHNTNTNRFQTALLSLIRDLELVSSRWANIKQKLSNMFSGGSKMSVMKSRSDNMMAQLNEIDELYTLSLMQVVGKYTLASLSKHTDEQVNEKVKELWKMGSSDGAFYRINAALNDLAIPHNEKKEKHNKRSKFDELLLNIEKELKQALDVVLSAETFTTRLEKYIKEANEMKESLDKDLKDHQDDKETEKEADAMQTQWVVAAVNKETEEADAMQTSAAVNGLFACVPARHGSIVDHVLSLHLNSLVI
jgi:hypothetical protein